MPNSFTSFLNNLSRLAFLFAFLFIEISAIYPQQALNFEHFTTKNGLLTDEVFNMHQDKKGYVWIFSKYGTLKYNGFQFKQVLKNLPFKESFIYTAFERADGRMWVANSNARVYEIRNDSAHIVNNGAMETVSAQLKKGVQEILYLRVDDSLNYYILTKSDSYKLQKTKSGYDIINLCDSFDSDSVMYRFSNIKEGSIVYGSRAMNNGTIFFSRNTKNSYIEIVGTDGKKLALNPFFDSKFKIMNTYIRGIRKFHGAYYFGSSNCLARLDETGKCSFYRLNTLVLNFAISQSGHFWMGCFNDGLYELDENGKILNHYLHGVTVNDVLFDHQQGLWLTTSNQGLLYCENYNEKIHLKETPLGDGPVILKIIDDRLYVANNKQEMFEFSDTSKKQISPAVEKAEIYDILKYDGKIVISDLYGMRSLDSQSGRAPWNGSAMAISFRKMFNQGSDTVVGVTRKTISYLINRSLRKAYYCDKKILSVVILNDSIWFGTNEGIYVMPKKFKEQGKFTAGRLAYDSIVLNRPAYLKNTTKASIVNAFIRGKEIWFCSEGEGLFRLKDGQLLNFNANNGLPDNIVNHFFISDSGLALLSTNAGLFFAGNFSPEVPVKWTKVFSGTALQALIYKNVIYVATRSGLILLDPNQKYFGSKPILRLASVSIDSAIVRPDLFHKISSDEKGLSFNFEVIDYSKTKSQIKYKLTGALSDSGFIEGKTLRIGRLPLGTYTLQVQIGSVVSSDSSVSAVFEVYPTFTQTITFKVLFVVCIVLIIVGAVRIIAYNRQKREAMRIKNEQLILEYKLIALKAQVNPHFMSNCLSSIQDLIMTGQNDKANYYIAEFGLMVRQILDYSSKQLITLEEELSLVKIYVELERLRFDNKFVVHIDIHTELEIDKIMVPPLILNPLIENAIWHGLLPIQNVRSAELQIKITKRDEDLQISIIDNGAGRSGRKARISNNKNVSYGLQITEQRLANLNYLYNTDRTSVEFIDLFDAKGQPTGTHVAITIPMNLTIKENAEN